MSELSPPEIVRELDRHIVGQAQAKRAVAIALRNRWRRLQVPEALRPEIVPKNILMIGPTGVGKTEIARRLARLADAPFIKIEATKFTEVGYVGRDVESIVRDLVESAIKQQRARAMEQAGDAAVRAAEERILDALLPPARGGDGQPERDASPTREIFRRKLKAGELDDKEIDIELSSAPVGVEIMGPPGMEDMTQQLQSLFANFGADKKKSRRLTVRDALRRLRDEESARLVNEEDIKTRAIYTVEQSGIVFLDELDKVCRRGETSGADVSREGVQRDLLPLIEGCTVNTKYGMVRTDHILFIASGAFHLAKPSDLIPELQGRLPIRVELDALTPDDFERILTEPDASLTRQYQALLAIEGVTLTFTQDGIRRLAEIAWEVNERTENIGARRLHTVMERLLESISFDAATLACQEDTRQVTVDAAFVGQTLGELAKDEDLSRYIL